MLTLLIPVKPPALAKSRLRGVVPAHRHADLVRAMLLDTAHAAVSAGTVGHVIVISVDPTVPAALSDLPVTVVTDEPGPDLNAALRHAAARLTGPVGALQADLPALRPGDLDEAVIAAGGRRAYCADRHSTGTTLLLAGDDVLRPAFGPASARAHRAGGALPLTVPVPSLRCDVDTPADLTAAGLLGTGPRTTALLQGLPVAADNIKPAGDQGPVRLTPE